MDDGHAGNSWIGGSGAALVLRRNTDFRTYNQVKLDSVSMSLLLVGESSEEKFGDDVEVVLT